MFQVKPLKMSNKIFCCCWFQAFFEDFSFFLCELTAQLGRHPHGFPKQAVHLIFHFPSCFVQTIYRLWSQYPGLTILWQLHFGYHPMFYVVCLCNKHSSTPPPPATFAMLSSCSRLCCPHFPSNVLSPANLRSCQPRPPPSIPTVQLHRYYPPNLTPWRETWICPFTPL